MRILAVHVRAAVLELLRYPSFSLSALVFPATLFLVFLHAFSQPPDTRMAGFAAVAVLGVVFFQFGVGIASERTSGWELFLRTLPLRPRVRIGARVSSALLFGTAAAGGVVATALATTQAALPPVRWLALAAALLLGGAPFGLLGIAIGYAVRPRAALPLANLLYLPLSYAGGLWAGPGRSPRVAGAVDLVPTHAWARLLWAAVGASGFDAVSAALLAAWGFVFGIVAVAAYRRDEGERFR